MKKLSEVSKRLDTILKVFWGIMIVVGVLIVLLFGAFATIPALTEQMTGTWSVVLGNVELVLAESINENINFLCAEAVFILVTIAAPIVFFCYGITLLRKILGCMSECRPFDGTVSCNIRKLGELLVIASLVLNIANGLASAFLFKTCNLSEILLSDMVVEVNTDFYVIDPKMLFLGVLVIVLSYVFKYGEELQKQADETL